MSQHRIANEIATRVATQLIRESVEAGLSWLDTLMTIETALAIQVSVLAKLSGAPDQLSHVTEIMDTITERAHGRVIALIQGVPFDH